MKKPITSVLAMLTSISLGASIHEFHLTLDGSAQIEITNSSEENIVPAPVTISTRGNKTFITQPTNEKSLIVLNIPEDSNVHINAGNVTVSGKFQLNQLKINSGNLLFDSVIIDSKNDIQLNAGNISGQIKINDDIKITGIQFWHLLTIRH